MDSIISQESINRQNNNKKQQPEATQQETGSPSKWKKGHQRRHSLTVCCTHNAEHSFSLNSDNNQNHNKMITLFVNFEKETSIIFRPPSNSSVHISMRWASCRVIGYVKQN